MNGWVVLPVDLCRFNPETGKFLPEYIDLASDPGMEYFVFIKTGRYIVGG
jgi:hypothetical protein